MLVGMGSQILILRGFEVVGIAIDLAALVVALRRRKVAIKLLVTGMRLHEPPEGIAAGIYLLMRFEGDGAHRVLWSNDRTWMVQPRASPSGRHVALDGLTFRSELVALEIGSVCEGPH
jgi:hypothetical protein